MASVTRDARPGRDGWRVRFYVDKHRRELYFSGRKRDADDLARKCEALASVKSAGLSPDPELAAWARRLDGGIRESLVRWGLCEPASPKLSTDQGKYLDPFLTGYIASRTDVVAGSRRNLDQARRVLVAYFGERRLLRSITQADAVRWQRWAISEKGLAVATASMYTKKAKVMFKAAVEDGLIDANPFVAVKGLKESNVERQRFIPRETIDRILDECPGPQWRLIVVLCRYAGLRCPSEVLGLQWSDLDWKRGSLRIDSPKTGLRLVPMFPEVRFALEDAFDAAPKGSVRCVDEYHRNVANLRTQFARILKRSGVEPWPRIFHNLRASRRTELQEKLPDHVINKWLGQSSRVAEEHYLTVHDEHWERALNLSPTRPPIAVRTDSLDAHHPTSNPNVLIGCDGLGWMGEYPRQDSNL
jgi:integrase